MFFSFKDYNEKSFNRFKTSCSTNSNVFLRLKNGDEQINLLAMKAPFTSAAFIRSDKQDGIFKEEQTKFDAKMYASNDCKWSENDGCICSSVYMDGYVMLDNVADLEYIDVLTVDNCQYEKKFPRFSPYGHNAKKPVCFFSYV